MSPSITWEHDGLDSGDFAAAVASQGVPHPTGYPAYLLAADLFVRLPWGDPAYRLNMLSACAAALAAGMMVLLVSITLHNRINTAPEREQTNPAWAISATSAGFVLAFAPLVWSQAVITEVYTLHVCFFLGAMLTGLWGRRKKNYGAVILAFAILGAGLGNHLSLVITLPGLLWLLGDLIRFKPLKFFAYAFLGLALGLCVYLVIPWRAAQNPPINWGGASDWQGFWWLVTGQLYQGLVLALPIVYLPMRLAAWVRIMFAGVNGWGLPLAILGIINLWERDRRLAVSTLLVFVPYSVYAVLYDTTDSYVYLMPALVVLILWMAHGLHWALRLIWQRTETDVHKAWLRRTLILAVILLSLIGIPWHWSAQDLSDNTEAIDYALEALGTVDAGSLIIVEGDAHTFSLWYARYGLRNREDVAVVNDALLQFDWYRTILKKYHPEVMGEGDQVTALSSLLSHNAGNRPIYFSDRPELVPIGYQIEASGNLWQLIPATSIDSR